jgi:hypothetical protein
MYATVGDVPYLRFPTTTFRNLLSMSPRAKRSQKSSGWKRPERSKQTDRALAHARWPENKQCKVSLITLKDSQCKLLEGNRSCGRWDMGSVIMEMGRRSVSFIQSPYTASAPCADLRRIKREGTEHTARIVGFLEIWKSEPLRHGGVRNHVLALHAWYNVCNAAAAKTACMQKHSHNQEPASRPSPRSLQSRPPRSDLCRYRLTTGRPPQPTTAAAIGARSPPKR